MFLTDKTFKKYNQNTIIKLKNFNNIIKYTIVAH